MKPVAIFFILFSILLPQDSPVQMEIRKSSEGAYNLKLSVPGGFAIQKDAPNKIKLSSEGNLKIESFSGEFIGRVKLDSPEYYDSLNDFPIKMKGSGTLVIDSKIFYCDLKRGICYPAKISKREVIK